MSGCIIFLGVTESKLVISINVPHDVFVVASPEFFVCEDTLLCLCTKSYLEQSARHSTDSYCYGCLGSRATIHLEQH